MLPTDNKFGSWPRSGEIDIMEHVSCDIGDVHATVHTESYNHMKNTQKGGKIAVSDVTMFHTYSIDWTPTKITAYVDDVMYWFFVNDGTGNPQTWPFDEDFHLILNVAVGGMWGGYCLNGRMPDWGGKAQRMLVDSVKVYSYEDEGDDRVDFEDEDCTAPFPQHGECEERMTWMSQNWNVVSWKQDYINAGVDGSRCSIQIYLFGEGYCPYPSKATVEPTMELTEKPTLRPTSNPTVRQTARPTGKTDAPTRVPSAHPQDSEMSPTVVGVAAGIGGAAVVSVVALLLRRSRSRTRSKSEKLKRDGKSIAGV